MNKQNIIFLLLLFSLVTQTKILAMNNGPGLFEKYIYTYQRYMPLFERFMCGGVSEINDDGLTELHCAALNNRLALVRTLIEKRIDINVQDKYGQSALHLAAANNHFEVVKLLLQQQAQVDLQDKKGRTPLHHATAGNHVDIVMLLLQYKANINQQDMDGRTALHIASLHDDYLDVVKLLVENRANIYIPNNDIKTALDIAKTFKANSVAQYLELQDPK
jgi:ankyrin repeat protein